MKIKKVFNDRIIFDNNSYLTDFHEQDCYEEVYADFGYIKNYNIIEGNKTVFDLEFNENFIDDVRLVKGEGFIILDNIGNYIFVPCYNIQNGYYNDSLYLDFFKDDKRISRLDISECSKFEEG